mgnify:CR=1 FL=1
MVIIEEVVFVLTPFHIKSIVDLFPELLYSKSTLVFKANYLEISDMNCHFISFDNNEFSRKELLRNPIKGLKETRNNLNRVDSFLRENLEPFNLANNVQVYLGNDKDIYTQRFIQLHKKRIENLIAIDEGLGFYVKEDFKDRLFKVLYPVLTTLFFSKKIHFIKRLGTHPLVNKIFLRDIELLKEKNPEIQYLEYSKGNTRKIGKIKSGKVLIYSFPEQDLAISKARKGVVYADIINSCLGRGLEVIIKPHPREDIEEMIDMFDKKEGVTFLPKEVLGESVLYEEYELIISFFSSIILDLINRGYPKERILTIGFTSKPLVDFSAMIEYHYFNDFYFSKSKFGNESYS